MSFAQHSITASIIRLEATKPHTPHEKAELTCCFFLNSHLLAISKIDETQEPVKVVNAFPHDTLQLMFYKNSQKELLGSVSFVLGQFFIDNQSQIVQWVNLSEDADNDVFNQNFGEECKGWPRALISFEIQENNEAIRRQSDQHKTTFEAYLKQKEQEIDQQQLSGSASLELSYNNNTYQKLNRLTMDLNENTENFLVRPASRNSIDNFNLENNDCFINNSVNSGCMENKKTENSLNVPNQAVSHKEIGDTQGIETCASIGSIKWDKQAVSRSFNLKEFGFDLTNYVAKDKTSLKDDVLKQNLMNKDEELNTLLENLQDRKEPSKDIEDLHATDFTTMQAENDTLRESCQRYEAMLGNLNKHAQDLQVQLKTQEDTQMLLLEENKSLALAVHRKQLAYDLLLEKGNGSSNSERCSCHNMKQSPKEELLENQNRKLVQELNALQSQKSASQAMIYDLQNEIEKLKENEDDANLVRVDLAEALEKIQSYEESFTDLINKCGLDQLQFKTMDFESLVDFVNQIQNELAKKIVELNDTKANVEELIMELCQLKNQCEGFSHGQDSGQKDRIRLLEQERDSLKDELFTANENYMKLTNKYIELSDTLESLQKTAQTNQQVPVFKTTLAPPQVIPQASAKTNRNNEEGIDEIETKLIQFLIYYKIQPSILTRVEKGVYHYNDKKVYLRICNGHLVVRVGDGYKPLQEFLKVKSSNSLQTRGLKPFNNPKSTKREEKSFEKKQKFGISNYYTNQLTENSQPDISLDLTTSRSVARESTRNTAKYQPYLAITERIKQENEGKLLGTGNLRLKEILGSRSVEKKTPSSYYRGKDKSYRELTIL